MGRQDQITLISRRLLLYSGIALLLAGILFLGALDLDGDGEGLFLLTPIVLSSGVLGGFVSIQQRLQKLGDQEVKLLSASRGAVLLIPLFGGILALVLYVLFLTEMLDINLFPKFQFKPFSGDRTADLIAFVKETYPKSGQDMAKLLFWSFVAGFSERFVPKVIKSVSSHSEGDIESVAPEEQRETGGQALLMTTVPEQLQEPAKSELPGK